MARANSAPQNLGRLTPVGEADLVPGVILWDRYCILEEPRESGDIQSITATDTRREFGDPPGHQVELQLFDLPTDAEARTRLRRALTITTRVQPQVFAYGTVGAGRTFALVCEPPYGRPLDNSPLALTTTQRDDALDSAVFASMANELSALLTRLHSAKVTGVRFTRSQLRVADGRVILGNFGHLLSTPSTPERDVEALLAFLTSFDAKIGMGLSESEPRSAEELWSRVREQVEGATVGDVELPAEPPFVGREDALRDLMDGLAQAEIAQPTAIVVQGRRGVGKSRLLREFVSSRLEADDAFVLTGTWQPRSAETRGGLLGAVEQLTRMLHNLNPEERESVRHRINRATRNLGAIVTRSAPSLGGILRGIEDLAPLELSGDFSRHTSVIADLLRAIGTQKRPLVLVLDNLEMADSRSLAILNILNQARPAHHTLIVAGCRNDSSNDVDFSAEEINLAALTTDEVGQLLDRTLVGNVEDQADIAAQLWSVSRGYPLSIWANLRAWIDRRLLVHDVATGSWRAARALHKEAEAEPDVRDLFSFRLAGAAPEVRKLALRMAVLGLELSSMEVRDLANDDEISVDEALDDLFSRGILTRSPLGVRFPHDTIRELVIESAKPEQRRAAHAAVGALLLRNDAPVAQVAYHRDLALDPDTATSAELERLLSLHIDAGYDRLGTYDLERARWHLERALEYSRDPDQRALAAGALADVYLLCADFDSAIALFTALIAASDELSAARAAGKAVYFLFFQNLAEEAQQLGDMALEVIHEPMPKTNLGRILVAMRSFLGALFRKPPHGVELRDALCVLYTVLTLNSVVTNPVATVFYFARGYWMTKELRTGPAAVMLSMIASMRAAFGHHRAANRIFEKATAIADNSDDPWARGVVAHNWAHNEMLPTNRYEEGQDRIDDALAAFRETGDMSVALISLMMKAVYGKDREPAGVVLGWLDEAVSVARRNGKSLILSSIEAIRLVVYARQGRRDISDRIKELSETLNNTTMSAVDRIFSRGQLALAAHEFGERRVAYEQAIAGEAEVAELPGVPDFCLELHFAAALVISNRPQPSREDRQLLRQVLRKLKRAGKVSPRMAILHRLFLLKQALAGGKLDKARSLAQGIISDFSAHGNIYATREAHLALSQVFKAENVLAAAEHDRITRSLGRQLELPDISLTGELSESFEGAAGLMALASPEFLGEPEHHIPAAGMLSSSVAEPVTRLPTGSITLDAEHDDVLEAWALSSSAPAQVSLGEVLEPLKNAISATIKDSTLDINCPDPQAKIPLALSDLQVLIMNMVLSGRDAVGSEAQVNIDLEIEELGEGIRRDATGRDRLPPGRYLVIRVSARGNSTTRSPVIGGFTSCESMLKQLGGTLTASADRARTILLGRIPLSASPPSSRRDFGTTIIVHPDAAVRETLSSALAELGARAIEYEPDHFEVAHLEAATLLLADGGSLEELHVLEPLISARLVEIVRRGAKPLDASPHQTLRIPFALSEIEDLLE